MLDVEDSLGQSIGLIQPLDILSSMNFLKMIEPVNYREVDNIKMIEPILALTSRFCGGYMIVKKLYPLMWLFFVHQS